MKFNTKLHLAVALKYTLGEDLAPWVIASGKGALADAVIKKAKELEIPIHPDKELAELLGEVETGTTIPEELYEVVAQIMAMIYRMDAALNQRI